MKNLLRSACVLAVGLPALLSTGCAVSGEAYGYDDGAAYYQGYAPVYGGWNRDYQVGPVGPPREGDHRAEPPREGEHREEPHEARPPETRAGPAPRPVPSIPSRPPSGGGSHH
jgi:hypothetical protein